MYVFMILFLKQTHPLKKLIINLSMDTNVKINKKNVG